MQEFNIVWLTFRNNISSYFVYFCTVNESSSKQRQNETNHSQTTNSSVVLFVNESMYLNELVEWIIQWLTHKDSSWIQYSILACYSASEIAYSLKRYLLQTRSHFETIRNVHSVLWMSSMTWYVSITFMLSLSCDLPTRCITSFPFTTHLSWHHGIVKCPSDVDFRISPVVGHLCTFWLLYYEYCEFGHATSFTYSFSSIL